MLGRDYFFTQDYFEPTRPSFLGAECEYFFEAEYNKWRVPSIFPKALESTYFFVLVPALVGRQAGRSGGRRRARAMIPDASVVPTPFRLVRVPTACSRLGSFLKAFLLSVCTAFGVLIRTKLVS